MLKRILFLIPPVFATDSVTSNSTQGLGCGGGFGPLAEFLCKESLTGPEVGNRLNTVISGLIGFLTTIAGLWLIFQLIVAGYQWINAGGDKNNIEAAQKKIYHSLIGLIVVVLAWVIIGIIGTLLGLDDILNPGKVLQDLLL